MLSVKTKKSLEFPEPQDRAYFPIDFQHLSWKPSKYLDMCRKLKESVPYPEFQEV